MLSLLIAAALTPAAVAGPAYLQPPTGCHDRQYSISGAGLRPVAPKACDVSSRRRSPGWTSPTRRPSSYGAPTGGILGA